MTEKTEEVTEATEKTEESPFNAEGFTVFYQNENEPTVRQFNVDLKDLNIQAEKQNYSIDSYKGILYGFDTAVNLILSNYNISPRKVAIDAVAVSQELLEKISKALDEEEKKL